MRHSDLLVQQVAEALRSRRRSRRVTSRRVNSFWSLTMYDRKTQLLIEDPINRYLINSPMIPAMKTNADGSLTLYIQNKSPGTDE